MMKRLLYFFLGTYLTAFFFLSCGDDTSTTPKATTVTVSGRIIDSSGKGVAGVIIQISDKMALTDSTGEYSISGLSNGTYIVSIIKEGYTFSSSKMEVIISNSSVILTNIYVLSEVNLDNFIVSGVVIGQQGSGEPEVLLELKGTNILLTELTNLYGYYKFNNLINGAYILKATKRGFTFHPDSLTVVINNSNTEIQNIKADSTYFNIQGRIIDEMNNGISNAKIRLFGRAVFCDDDGYYDYNISFDKLNNNKNKIYITSDTFGYKYEQYIYEADITKNYFDVPDLKMFFIGFYLNVWIKNKNSDYRVQGASVHFTGAKTDTTFITDVNGRAVLYGLNHEPFTIKVSLDDFDVEPSEFADVYPSYDPYVFYINIPYEIRIKTLDEENKYIEGVTIEYTDMKISNEVITDWSGTAMLYLNDFQTFTAKAQKRGYDFTPESITIQPGETFTFTGKKM